MLAKKYRLRKNKDFERVAKKGRAAYGEALSIKWIKNNFDHIRVGIIVSLNVDKLAVKRNKIKRMLRAIVRKYKDRLIPGLDYLIITGPKIKNFKYKEIEQRFLHLVEKNHLLRNAHD